MTDDGAHAASRRSHTVRALLGYGMIRLAENPDQRTMLVQDPAEFECPGEFRVDRKPNRHLTFSSGPEPDPGLRDHARAAARPRPGTGHVRPADPVHGNLMRVGRG